MRARHLATLLGLSLLLGGCGFALRGTTGGGDYPPVQLQQAHTDNALRRRIDQQFDMHDIDVASSSALTLRISELERGDSVLSLDSNARTAERRLLISAKVDLLRDGETVQSLRLREQRILFTDPDNPVGDTTEQQLVIGELEAAMAEQIVRQLLHWLDKEQNHAPASRTAR